MSNTKKIQKELKIVSKTSNSFGDQVIEFQYKNEPNTFHLTNSEGSWMSDKQAIEAAAFTINSNG